MTTGLLILKRRALLLALPVLSTLPRLVSAQSTGKIYRVGLLGPALPFADQSPVVISLSKGFGKRGYKVGENLVFERRAAQENLALLPRLVDELNAANVDLIITVGYTAAAAAKQHA